MEDIKREISKILPQEMERGLVERCIWDKEKQEYKTVIELARFITKENLLKRCKLIEILINT